MESVKGRGKVMEVACEGKAGRKLALAILHHMDVSKATRMEVSVANRSRAALKVSVAFGAAPDWQMHETRPVTVPPSSDPRVLSFRLNRAHFKSEASGWKHTLKLPNEGRFDKMMILVDGLPGKGKVAFDNLRFSHGGFRPAAAFAHGGGEVRGIAWTDVNGDEMLDACARLGLKAVFDLYVQDWDFRGDFMPSGPFDHFPPTTYDYIDVSGEGIMLANGLIYTPPHSCGCYMEAKLTGLGAVGPEPPLPVVSDEGRLARGVLGRL